MKKLVITIILLALIFSTAMGEEIVLVEPVISNGSLSFYLNSSDGSVSEFSVNNLSCYSIDNNGIFTYEVDYRALTEGISVNYRMFNCFDSLQSVCCVAALFRNGVLEKIEFENTVVSANSAKEITLKPIEVNPETDKIQAYVWDSFGGMKPLGKSDDIDYENSVLSRKFVYVNCDAEEKFKIYITSPNVSENISLNYNLGYASDKIVVENLCAFSYPSVLSCGYVKNAGINILEFSHAEGFIRYSVKSSGNLCGINNVMEFSANEPLINEEISLVVTK